jgi:hypothetical protein
MRTLLAGLLVACCAASGAAPLPHPGRDGGRQAIAQDAAAARLVRVCLDADAPVWQDRVLVVLAAHVPRPLKAVRLPLPSGFVGRTDGVCDAFVAVPEGFERLLTTRPYLRSGWVVATRADDPAPLAGLDDSRLSRLRLGVVVPGDGSATPPGLALAARGAFAGVVGYVPDGVAPVPLRMLQDVRRARLDAAFLWGPQAAEPAGDDVRLALLPAAVGGLPMRAGIAVGVRGGDGALRDELQAGLDAGREQIDALLAAHRVPRTDR